MTGDNPAVTGDMPHWVALGLVDSWATVMRHTITEGDDDD